VTRRAVTDAASQGRACCPTPGAALLARAHGGAQITGAAVYPASLSALSGTSTPYRRGTWTAVWRSGCGTRTRR
jgi:hypothetical protein